MTAQGIDVSGQVIVLHDLQADLEAGGVSVPYGLVITGPPNDNTSPPTAPSELPPPCPDGALLFMHDDQYQLADLPAEALPILTAYSP